MRRARTTPGRLAVDRPRRKTGDTLRPHPPGVTEDEKLLRFPSAEAGDFTHTDTRRVLRIMGEFIAGFDTLAGIDEAVTIFGSARCNIELPFEQRPDPYIDTLISFRYRTDDVAAAVCPVVDACAPKRRR